MHWYYDAFDDSFPMTAMSEIGEMRNTMWQRNLKKM